MGIDISAYKQLEKFDCSFDIDGDPIDKETGECFGWEDGIRRFYKNDDFPGRADDIDEKTAYKYADSDSFFSTGYSRYNYLRNQLAKIAGYPLDKYEPSYGGERESYCVACWNGEAGPFSEVIHFSDCEGVIGSKVSKKLLKDFNEFQSKADAMGDEIFLNFYNSMKSAFEMAADNGIVDFH